MKEAAERRAQRQIAKLQEIALPLLLIILLVLLAPIWFPAISLLLKMLIMGG